MLALTLKKFCKLYISERKAEDIDVILKSSPYYPSLLSIIHTLRCVGIKAVAGKSDITHLQKMNTPFLLHIKKQNAEKIVLAHLSKKTGCIAIYSPKNDVWIEENMSEMIGLWDGVIIYSEQKNKTGLSQKSLRNALSFIAIFFGTVVSPILIALNYGDKAGFIFFLIISGLIISICTLAKDYGNKNRLLDKMCKISTHIDCQIVSKSKYGDILGIKISALATSFFISQFCMGLITLAECNTPIVILESAVIIVLPVLVYSTITQILLKHMCLFCIGIIGIILVQTLIVILNESADINIGINIATYLLTIIIALTIKSLQNSSDSKLEQKKMRCDLLKLKRKTFVLFNESIQFSIETEKCLFYEVPDSFTETPIVTSIISPSCPNCKKLAKEILELFDKRIVPFHWAIILGETHRTDRELNKKWLACYLNNSQAFFKQFRKWCNGEHIFDGKSNSSIYVETETIEYLQYFDKMMKNYKLRGLPRLAVNNRLLSSVYNGCDILYILVDSGISKKNDTI